MQRKVQRGEAVSQAKSALVADDVDRRFEAMAKTLLPRVRANDARRKPRCT